MARRDEAERRPAASAPPRGYARMRARDDATRARLEPLAPGERPRAVSAAAILAVLIALGNLAALAGGTELDGRSPAPGLAFCAVMLAAAAGMWWRRYWAVLAFEVLLGIAIVYAALALLVASNWHAAAISLGVIAICGPLFWFLIRAMARMQIPRDS